MCHADTLKCVSLAALSAGSALTPQLIKRARRCAWDAHFFFALICGVGAALPKGIYSDGGQKALVRRSQHGIAAAASLARPQHSSASLSPCSFRDLICSRDTRRARNNETTSRNSAKGHVPCKQNEK
jgi:hypothetical protein